MLNKALTGWWATCVFTALAINTAQAATPRDVVVYAADISGTPSDPAPSDGATNISPSPTLLWTSSGATSYDVYFGPSYPPPQVTVSQPASSYATGTLAPNTIYFWQVVAFNNSGATVGPVWWFTTSALGAPSNPAPSDRAANVSTSPTVTWTSPGATSYDVYFGTSYPPPQVAVSQSAASYAAGTLAANTTYFWQVVAFNNSGATVGPVWSLTTSGPGMPSSPAPSDGATTISTSPTLLWSSSGATSYDVYFGTSYPPPQATVSQSAASYVAGTLTPDTVYFWQVVAFNGSGATVGPVWWFTTGVPSSLPAVWQHQDVGAVGISGAASFSGGQFTVSGAGSDIWGSADAFQFVYQALGGDGQVVARVVSLQNTNASAKAGVMIRESLDPSSAHVILDVEPSGNIEFMARSADGGSTTWLAGATQAAPVWLKLARTGSTVTASVSADGVTWSPVGSTSTAMASNALIGMAVSSHDVTQLTTSNFDNVTVSAPPVIIATPPPPVTWTVSPAPSPSVTSPGALWTVNAGGDLQAALNNALPGDTILLQAGATFSGNFTLPVKNGASYITIRSSTPDASLPRPGTRIDPSYAPLLAKIQSPNSGAALTTAPGAHHYRLLLLEFLANYLGDGDVIDLGDGSSAQSALWQVPHDLIVDRLYIHGDVTNGQKRGIGLNSAATTIVNSYIAEIKANGQDSQAICGWNGPGPFLISNNYLEAAGENVLFGGADPSIPNLVPSDVTFTHNYVTKQTIWMTQSQWNVKNLFELKNVQRVLADGNVMEYNWVAAQPGYSVLFTPRNQDGTAPWSVVQQVQFSNNVVRHVSSAINILGADDVNPSQLANNLVIVNNLFEDISAATYGGAGRFVLINGGSAITFDHNTVFEDGTSALYAYTNPVASFVFTNNIVPDNSWAIMGSSTSPGNGTISTYFPASTFLGGIYAGSNPATYPAGNYYPATMSAVGFVNLSGGNYRLASTSLYFTAATDGTAVGCNINAVNAAAGTTY